eukprot:CAMPEP_0183336422 /NCGR_PEP_ID=MMETSP0164_2-20130417/4403_1 /TAXON_ID=221442 /ORGANISM="Coccolithus pelagicus ssp braarudi, Strain PLY182g" /LENGTH=240 /DNA_ID=CAMNT_0025505935 /DNA_START=14 /DNA_END=737 /DNA_ORIENTATION=-
MATAKVGDTHSYGCGRVPSSACSAPAAPLAGPASIPHFHVVRSSLGGDRREMDSDEADRPQFEPRMPIASRARLSCSDAGTLTVFIPRSSLGTDAVMGGTFVVGWFATVAQATRASLVAGGGVPLLFLLPFWAAGALVAKQTLVDPATTTCLTIGRFAWELRCEVAGVPTREEDGATEALRGAVAEVVGHVNGVPSVELRLYTADAAVGLGASISVEEAHALAARINAHLETLGIDIGQA